LSEICEAGYKAAAQTAAERRKTVLWLWTKMKVLLGLYREKVWHLESKECLGQICALRHITAFAVSFY